MQGLARQMGSDRSPVRGTPAEVISQRAERAESERAEDLGREALRLWLKWNTAHEQLTAAMFQSRHDPARMAELMQEMDHLEQVRWRAVELSEELLEAPVEP